MRENTYELKFLEAAAPELKDYLLSADVYRELGLRAPAGSRPYPQFSLGWVLLFRRRVQENALSEDDRNPLRVISEIENQWRSNWAKKAAQEFSMRLKLWTNYLNELREHPETHGTRYRYEVQRRTMLELLAADADDIPNTEKQLLRLTDAALKRMLRPGPFIEDPVYADRFPPERFWYLYGTIKGKD